MLELNPKYITDENGNKVSVIIPFDEYKTMMEELEELYDSKLYDEVKNDRDVFVPIYKAFQMIEEKRNDLHD